MSDIENIYMYASIRETLQAVRTTLHARLGLNFDLAIDSKVLIGLFAEKFALLLPIPALDAQQQLWQGLALFLPESVAGKAQRHGAGGDTSSVHPAWHPVD